MTGEITLRGHLLPVTGIKEKCLAAHRAGLRHVILPKRNEPELDEVPEAIRKDLSFHLVGRIEEVLPLVLEIEPPAVPRPPAPPAAGEAAATS